MAQISIINKAEIDKAKRFDAEYFKHEYLEIENKLNKLNSDYLGNIVDNVFTGKTPQYISKGENYVLRSGDLKHNLIDKNRLLQTDDKDLFFLEKNDILISSIGRGSIGKVAINFQKENITTVSEVSVLRNIKINPCFVQVLLLSYFGQNQIEKFITGATGQLHLLPSNIKKIKIPILPEKFQLEIEAMVKKAHAQQQHAKQLYGEAEQMLLQELNLIDYQPKHTLWFETTKSQIDDAKRCDAEYFQPKYDDIIKKIESYQGGWDFVGNVVSYKKGIEVGSSEYKTEGKDFLRVADFSSLGFDKIEKKISEKLFEEFKLKFKPKIGEILFTKDATLGISYVVKEELKGIVSVAFLRCSLKKDYRYFEKEFISLCFNSIFCKLQIEQLSGGGVINHLRPDDFEKIKIPLIDKNLQTQIAANIKKSFDLRKESKQLLAEAKLTIEQTIESM